MVVMKFGGTSIQDPTAIFRACEITRHQMENNPVVICSAMGKTTRGFLEIARVAADGNPAESKKRLESILDLHVTLGEQLFTSFTLTQTFKNIQKMIEDIQSQIEELNQTRELTPQIQDHILAYGELISTNIIAMIFQEGGIESQWVDARQCIVTDDQFTCAIPHSKQTYEKIQKVILPVVKQNKVVITQGFIGATKNGVTTTLGFEGSDFTATMIGAALNADEIQIWKDVDGVLTTDPTIYSGATLVPVITYAEAEELTYFGAKVLHPLTLEPARKKNIPIFVKNAKKTLDTGTRILQTVPKSKNPVKSITYKKDLTVIQVNCEKEQQEDLINQIHGILNQLCNYPLISYSDQSKLSLVMETQVLSKQVIFSLGALGAVNLLENKTSVTLVGEGIGQSTETIQNVVDILSATETEIIFDKSSPLSLTLIVNETKLTEVIEKLHKKIFGV